MAAPIVDKLLYTLVSIRSYSIYYEHVIILANILESPIYIFLVNDDVLIVVVYFQSSLCSSESFKLRSLSVHIQAILHIIKCT